MGQANGAYAGMNQSQNELEILNAAVIAIPLSSPNVSVGDPRLKACGDDILIASSTMSPRNDKLYERSRCHEYINEDVGC